MAVAGLSNREIGAKLSLSDRTVEHHLGAVFAKLGVRSRGGLAALRARERARSGERSGQNRGELVIPPIRRPRSGLDFCHRTTVPHRLRGRCDALTRSHAKGNHHVFSR